MMMKTRISWTHGDDLFLFVDLHREIFYRLLKFIGQSHGTLLQFDQRSMIHHDRADRTETTVPVKNVLFQRLIGSM